MTTKATIIGIPLDLGAENLGVDVGPEAFRYQNIVQKLESAGLALTDSGNIDCGDRSKLDPGDPHQRYVKDISRISQEVATKSEAIILRGEKVIALGGDHSINLGVVSGASKAVNGELGLIYLDAHGDMNTPETSLSGNIHGMHLAALLGFGPDELTKIHSPEVKITKDTLLHIGGSDFDPAELELIEREKLCAYTMFDVLTKSFGPLMKLIEDLAERVSNIWVSMDLDVIDSVYAPGAGMPNKGGLTYREITAIADYVGRKCNVIGVDVVEYNPLQDVDGKTAELGIELIAKFLGTNYSWYTNYMDRNKVA